MTSKSNARKAKKTVQEQDNSHFQDDTTRNANLSTSSTALQSQQLVLNIFRTSFSDCFNDALSSYIQEVKGYLYRREFSEAFGSPDFIKAYALRWSPSRALAYLELLSDLPCLDAAFEDVSTSVGTEMQVDTTITTDVDPRPRNITCFGGGAGAEILAFAGYLDNFTARNPKATMALKLIDIANWDPVVEKLYSGATTRIRPPAHAAADSNSSRDPLVNPDRFSVSFEQQDILTMEPEHLARTLEATVLITLFFTLNELYSTSMTGTTNFLLCLTYTVEPGTLLLVIDSPGSYAEVQVGNSTATSSKEAEKRYPMNWLLDHTLLEASNIGSSINASGVQQWKKLVSNDSRWCRLPKDLKYPLALEDMRYQVHLYQRV
jgi:25S rRNA (uracil2843-N3)-methyltransferase